MRLPCGSTTSPYMELGAPSHSSPRRSPVATSKVTTAYVLERVGPEDKHTRVRPSALNAIASASPHIASTRRGEPSPVRDAIQISIPSSLEIAIAACRPARSVATLHEE